MLTQNLKRLSKDSLTYGFGSIVQFITSLLLLPIFTRIFSPSDYGIFDTISTVTSILILFLLMGLNSAVQRYYFDNQRDGNVIISTGFWFMAIISIVFCVILITNSVFLSNLLFNNTKYSILIMVAIATTPIALLISYIKDTSPWRYNIIGLVEFLLGVSIIIFLVVVLKKGILGSLLGTLIASLIALLLGIIFIRSKIVFKFSYHYLKKLLAYGLPLVIASLAYWVINLVDRLFILKLSTLDQLGLYSIGNKISAVIVLPITALQLAWAPLIFSNYSKEGSDKLIIKTLTYSFLIFIFVSICLTTFSYDILRILAPSSYINATNVVGLLTLGLVFLGVSGILATGITIAKKTKYITLSTLIAAGINITLNFLLIPRWGMIGAAIATLFAYFSLIVLYYRYSQKFFYLKYELYKILKILIIGIIFIIIGTFYKLDNIFYSLVSKIIFVSFFIAILFIFRVFNKDEINFVKNLWAKLINRNKLKLT